MRALSTDDLRKAYLEFFHSKEHAIIPGASLIPENDPTVLFTTAGMHPLVPYILGEPHPSGKRLADCQICIRTQDIDEVGDANHLTFFEMLGRWSLGDYFKEGAIQMSYTFLTEIIEIPKKMLAVSCFGGDDRFPEMPRDDESAAIWRSVGIPEERIGFIKGGMLESQFNWWGPAGRTGPCGPDTEMFYWVGDGKPVGNPATHPDCWLEIGNDVLIQYSKGPDGSFTPLSQKTIDEGLGLDRLAVVLQGVGSVYETDRMKPILDAVLTASGNPKTENRNPKLLRHARIVTDHLRAATFIIADGVMPSNVDQGYVLRRLIRRSIRSARTLGIHYDGSFAPSICTEVIAQYGHIYPHLRTHAKEIGDALRNEEQQFGKTLQEGLKHFAKVEQRATGNTISGIDAFHLYDTYGFPLELTVEMAKERNLTVDTEGFRKAFEEHQQKSREGARQRFAGGLADHSAETTKLHTATHLLNAALRKVLGMHVWQKGSNVTTERLRFDFSHPTKMTPEQIEATEDLVNDAIRRDLPVRYVLMTVEEAKKAGAIGVFEERYDEKAEGPEHRRRVKVYRIGSDQCHGEPVEPFSLEICGGPHVARTGLLGSFTIQKEEAVSTGIRRIKAVVSGGPKEITIAEQAPTPPPSS